MAGLQDDHSNVVFGCCLAMLAAFVFASGYIITEGAMSSPDPPNPKSVTFRMGLCITAACALYMVGYVLHAN